MEAVSGCLKHTSDMFEGIPSFPWLDIPYCVLMAVFLREQKDSVKFALNYPIASLMVLMLYFHANVICVHILLGLPLVACLGGAWDTLAAVACWWMVFCCPGDLLYRLFQIQPFQLIIRLLCEMRHARLVMLACLEAHHFFPNHATIIIICGLVDGCSGRLMMSFDRMIRADCAAEGQSELHQVTEVTKASLVLATFNCLVVLGFIPISKSIAVAVGAVFMCMLLLNNVINGHVDPFLPFQTRVWKILSANKNCECTEHEEKSEEEKKDE